MTILKKLERTKAAHLLLVVLTADASTIWQETDLGDGQYEWVMLKHPFGDNTVDYTTYLSCDPLAALRYMLTPSKDLIRFCEMRATPLEEGERGRFIFWGALASDDKDEKRHDFFLEAQGRFGSAIVSGMTDYSGGGGAILEIVMQVVALLEEMGIPASVKEISKRDGEMAWNLINKDIREQQDEK